MSAFRSSSHRHAGLTAPPYISADCDNVNPCYVPFGRSEVVEGRYIKVEPIEASIPNSLSSSPSEFSEPFGSPRFLYPQIDTKEGSSAPDQLLTCLLSNAFTLPTSKKTHGRRREPGHVPRPRNAFMVFRSEFVKQARDDEEDKQNELSKHAGRAWKNMSEEKKKRYRDIAAREQAEHKLAHPTYHYAPGPRRAKPKKRTTARRVNTASAVASISRRLLRSPSIVDNASSPPSLSSSASYSTEFMPSRSSHAPRVAAQAATQCFEQITSASSSHSPSPGAPEVIYSSSDEMMPQQKDFLSEGFISTNEIPVFTLDAATQDLSFGHNLLQDPSTLTYEHQNLGLNAYSYITEVPVIPRSAVVSATSTSASATLYDWNMSSQRMIPDLNLHYSYSATTEVNEEFMATRYGVGYEQYQPQFGNELSAYDINFWLQPETLSQGMNM